jgi:hypothetical protein
VRWVKWFFVTSLVTEAHRLIVCERCGGTGW